MRCYKVINSKVNELIVSALETRGAIKRVNGGGSIAFIGEPSFEEILVAVDTVLPFYDNRKKEDIARDFMSYVLNPCD